MYCATNMHFECGPSVMLIVLCYVKLSTLRTLIDNHQQLVASFELAFGKVKKTLAHSEASLKEIEESGDGDLPAHSAKVARIQVCSPSYRVLTDTVFF